MASDSDQPGGVTTATRRRTDHLRPGNDMALFSCSERRSFTRRMGLRTLRATTAPRMTIPRNSTWRIRVSSSRRSSSSRNRRAGVAGAPEPSQGGLLGLRTFAHGLHRLWGAGRHRLHGLGGREAGHGAGLDDDAALHRGGPDHQRHLGPGSAGLHPAPDRSDRSRGRSRPSRCPSWLARCVDAVRHGGRRRVSAVSPLLVISALALLASFGLVGMRLLRAPSAALAEERPV